MAETRINRGTKEKEVLRFSFESLILSEEDWDTIRAKLEANSGIKRVCFGKDLFSTKESLKRFGEELQTKTAKKLKFDDESYSTNRGEDKGQWKKIILLQAFKMGIGLSLAYLKNMEGKKLKDLKNKSFDSIQKMFDSAFKRVNTFVDFRTDLVEGSSKRAGEELE
ncbi:hypothetical protein Tco_1080357 [Tanacetum coccineum]|uniref:Uncharacterized protein n=1 Tax=Tanacetum coccineum TaxID=301880 RepID=A0ABQ5HW47_9ASTR